MTIDYQAFTNINTPKEERKKMYVGDIWSNGLFCKRCKTFIRSKNRHDFSTCECKACFIDGGSHYVRCGGERDDFELRTILFNDVSKGE